MYLKFLQKQKKEMEALVKKHEKVSRVGWGGVGVALRWLWFAMCCFLWRVDGLVLAKGPERARLW